MALKKDQKKLMELLAPAGSLEILKAVAAAGADAEIGRASCRERV